MPRYLALRIEKSALIYVEVVAKYPQFKGEIDEILIADGYDYLIV